MKKIFENPQVEITALCLTIFFCCLALLLYSTDFKSGVNEVLMPVMEVTGILIVAGGAFLCLLWQFIKKRTTVTRTTLAVIMLSGIACRIVLLFSEPIKENDMYRYMVDGNATLHGINPYAVEPNQLMSSNLFVAHETMAMREFIHGNKAAERVISMVNYPHFRTIYPPVAQVAFALSQWLTPWQLQGWRFVLVLGDLATVLVLLLLLAHLKLPRIWIVVYWLNPMILKEVYNSLHMDALIFPFMMGALLLVLKNRIRLAMVVLALAAGAKIWPAVFLPGFLLSKCKRPRDALIPLGIFGLLAGVIFLPMILAPLNQSTGLVAYTNFWMMNDAIFHLIAKTILWTFNFDKLTTMHIAKGVVALLILAWTVRVLRRPATTDLHLVNQSALILFFMYLFLPTQYPWYYCWLIPWLVLRPQTSLLLYSVALPVYYFRFYLMVHGEVALFDTYLVWAEHLPIYAAIIWEWRRGKWQAGDSALF